MTMRSIWKGSIGFGMVSIPVKMYGSSEDKRRTEVGMHNVHSECNTRLEQPKWCSHCNRKVEQSEIVKGYELDKEHLVIIQNGDLDHIQLESLKSITITGFIPSDFTLGPLADPRMTSEKSGYFLAPEEVGAKAFVLFMKAMDKAGVAGVAKVAVRGKEQLCVVYPFDGIMFLQTLHWADEVREYGELIPLATVTDKEMDMAVALISAMPSLAAGDLGKYRDEYRDKLKDLISAKIEGREIEVPPEAVVQEIDLEAQLSASLAAAGVKE